MGEFIGSEHRSPSVIRHVAGHEIGYPVHRHGIAVARSGKIAIPVGGSIDSGRIAVGTGPERYPLHIVNGIEEHPLHTLVADSNCQLPLGGVQRDVEVVSLVGLVAHNIGIAGSVLDTDAAVGGEFDSRACRSLFVLELDLELSVVVLGRFEVESHIQQLRRRHLSLGHGVVERIGIGKFQPLPVERYGSHQG